MRIVLVTFIALMALPLGFAQPAAAAGKKYISKNKHALSIRRPKSRAQVRGFRARSVGGYSYVWVDSLSDEFDVTHESSEIIDSRSLWERVQEEHSYP